MFAQAQVQTWNAEAIEKIKLLRGKQMPESDFLTMSGICKYWPAPPHINFETADFGEDAQDFIDQFYINAKRPDDVSNGAGTAVVKRQIGQPIEADESPIDDEVPTTTKRPKRTSGRRRQLLPGEFDGPILLRKRHGCRDSLPANYNERKKILAYEAAIHRGDLLPNWQSKEEANLMTIMWQKDRRFAIEARAFFNDRPKQNMTVPSSFFLKTWLGKVYLPDDLVRVSKAGEYSFTRIPKELRHFLIASVDKSEIAIDEEILDAMDQLDGWSLPVRSYDQKEADERETVDRMTREIFGTCFFCRIVTITSGYKTCGCFIVCLVCAEVFKRGDLYVCPRCEVASDCMVTPYHG